MDRVDIVVYLLVELDSGWFHLPNWFVVEDSESRFQLRSNKLLVLLD